MTARTAGLTLALCLSLSAWPAEARPTSQVGAQAKTWVSMVVDRIGRADRPDPGSGRGTVTIRLRIMADGTLAGAEIEESSGSPVFDARALRAAKAAGPFRPPPTQLLTLDGFTELSFDLALPSARPR